MRRRWDCGCECCRKAVQLGTGVGAGRRGEGGTGTAGHGPQKQEACVQVQRREGRGYRHMGRRCVYGRQAQVRMQALMAQEAHAQV